APGSRLPRRSAAATRAQAPGGERRATRLGRAFAPRATARGRRRRAALARSETPAPPSAPLRATARRRAHRAPAPRRRRPRRPPPAPASSSRRARPARGRARRTGAPRTTARARRGSSSSGPRIREPRVVVCRSMPTRRDPFPKHDEKLRREAPADGATPAEPAIGADQARRPHGPLAAVLSAHVLLGFVWLVVVL